MHKNLHGSCKNRRVDSRETRIYSHFILVPRKRFYHRCFFQFSAFEPSRFPLSSCSARNFSDKIFPDIYRGNENEILYFERNRSRRERRKYGIRIVAYLLGSVILAPPFPILFFVQSPIIAECPSYILIFFHAGHVYTGNSRRRWLRSSRSRGRGIDSEQTSRIRGTWERVRIQESSRICVKNNHENDYGCRMRIIFLSL